MAFSRDKKAMYASILGSLYLQRAALSCKYVSDFSGLPVGMLVFSQRPAPPNGFPSIRSSIMFFDHCHFLFGVKISSLQLSRPLHRERHPRNRGQSGGIPWLLRGLSVGSS